MPLHRSGSRGCASTSCSSCAAARDVSKKPAPPRCDCVASPSPPCRCHVDCESHGAVLPDFATASELAIKHGAGLAARSMPCRRRLAGGSPIAGDAVLPDFAAASEFSVGAVLPDFASAARSAAEGGAELDAGLLSLYAPDAVREDFVAAWWVQCPLSAGAPSSALAASPSSSVMSSSSPSDSSSTLSCADAPAP